MEKESIQQEKLIQSLSIIESKKSFCRFYVRGLCLYEAKDC
jgi:hypothetical protein